MASIERIKDQLIRCYEIKLRKRLRRLYRTFLPVSETTSLALIHAILLANGLAAVV